MSTPPEDPTPPAWSDDEDVYDTLGNLGAKIKAHAEAGRFSIEAQLAAARSEAFVRLTRVYGRGSVPEPPEGSTGLEVVRWAVARLAAANVLDILRGALPDVSELPERLRRTAWATLDSGVPGYLPGGGEPSTGTVGPIASSGAAVSAFLDPYAYGPDARYGAYGRPGRSWV